MKTIDNKWGALLILSVAELLGMSLWMTASSVSPQLQQLWSLDASQAAWLTTMVQIGFVVGTALAALLNIADLLSTKWLFAGSAILGGLSNLLLLTASGYETALLCRFATGFFLAGVYPPAMKMIATWFNSSRGLAIGTIVGALVLGKATPYLIKAMGGADWQTVVWVASCCALGSALLVAWGYHEGPHPFAKRPFSLRLVSDVWRHRRTRLAIIGYLGHMWELYAMWVWIPAFLAAAAKQAGETRVFIVDLAAFSIIGIGSLGCVWGGWVADRIGRPRLVNLCLLLSASCAIGIGLLFGSSFAWVALLAAVWGFFVVADSAQFSAMVTEVAPQHAVGTALTLQTSMGFCLTALTIQGIAWLQPLLGWKYVFILLAIGPIFGSLAITRFQQRNRVRSRNKDESNYR